MHVQAQLQWCNCGGLQDQVAGASGPYVRTDGCISYCIQLTDGKHDTKMQTEYWQSDVFHVDHVH